MSSGKQLAFSYGEVSKLLQYKVSATFYAQALAQAVNGIVRKTGGFSNRPGTVYTYMTPYLEGLYTDGRTGIRVCSVGKFLIVINEFIEATPEDWDWDTNPTCPLTWNFKIYDLTRGINNDAEMGFLNYVDNKRYVGGPQGRVYFDLDACSVTAINGLISIILYEKVDGSLVPYVLSFREVVTENPSVLTFERVVEDIKRIGTPGSSMAISTTQISGTLEAPVCYLVTQEKINGEEALWGAACFAKGHPHDQCQSRILFTSDTSPDVKQYLIYRSSSTPTNIGDSVKAGSYGLVGRVAPNTEIRYGDYLTVADVTIQPPLDNSLLPPTFQDGIGVDFKPIQLMRRIAQFKERTIIAYPGQLNISATLVGDNAINKSLGVLGLSKLGTQKMMSRGASTHPIDAFSFAVPKQKLNAVNHIKSSQGLLIFTDDATVLATGDESGIISADTVNPIVISNEGCPLRVEPDEALDFTYFVNTDLSKLLVASFSNQGRSAGVAELSNLSTHLFEARNAKRVVATSGETVNVWVLKRDGQLICLSHSPENEVIGFSRVKVDGFIEDICQIKISNNLYPGMPTNGFVSGTEVILMSVIRNGVRNIEFMTPRNDLEVMKMFYADSIHIFGVGDEGYKYTDESPALNIVATDYRAGYELSISAFTLFEDFFPEGIEGESIKFKVDNVEFVFVITERVDGLNVKAVSLTDVPTILQDVDSQPVSSEVKAQRQKSFIYLTKVIAGLERFANKEVSVFVEGQTLSSPLNPNMQSLTVGPDGVLDLGGAYQWGYVGLPYEYLMETLRLEASDARTFTDKGKNINQVGVAFEKTLGGLITQYDSSPLSEAEELVIKDSDVLTGPIKVKDGVVNRLFPAEWNDTGSLCIRQVDPLPITVVAVYPKGIVGD